MPLLRVLQRGRCNRGGAHRFGGNQHNVGGIRLDRDRRQPAAEKFGDATTASCCIVVAAHEGGPTGLEETNIMVAVPVSIEVDDNPLPKNSVMPLLRRVAAWS